MKTLFSVAVLFTVMLHSFSNLLIIGGYYINKNYIAENLCENKAKPELQCEGKCHLTKQLKASEEKTGEDNPPVFEESTPLMYCHTNDIRLSPLPDNPAFFGLFQNSFYSYTSADDIFHPPQIA